MRRILALLLLLCLVSTGCLGNYVNLEQTMYQKRDLTGLSQEQVIQMFGYPTSTYTSYVGGNKIEHWTYEHKSMNMLGPSGSLSITLTNGVVSSTSYY